MTITAFEVPTEFEHSARPFAGSAYSITVGYIPDEEYWYDIFEGDSPKPLVQAFGLTLTELMRRTVGAVDWANQKSLAQHLAMQPQRLAALAAAARDPHTPASRAIFELYL